MTRKEIERPDIEIKVWMARNELNMVKIGKAYGVGGRFVSQFIRGIKTSKGLANFMVEQGCPAECFKNGKLATTFNGGQ